MKIKYTVNGKEFFRELPKAQIEKMIGRELAFMHKMRVEKIKEELPKLREEFEKAKAKMRIDRALAIRERYRALETELKSLT